MENRRITAANKAAKQAYNTPVPGWENLFQMIEKNYIERKLSEEHVRNQIENLATDGIINLKKSDPLYGFEAFDELILAGYELGYKK